MIRPPCAREALLVPISCGFLTIVVKFVLNYFLNVTYKNWYHETASSGQWCAAFEIRIALVSLLCIIHSYELEVYNTIIYFELLKTHEDKIIIHLNLTSTFKNNKTLCQSGPETLAACWRAFVDYRTTEHLVRCIDVSRFIASRYM